jgi:hypothetical protein
MDWKVDKPSPEFVGFAIECSPRCRRFGGCTFRTTRTSTARGFVSSQAFVDRYQTDGPISTLLPTNADTAALGACGYRGSVRYAIDR